MAEFPTYEQMAKEVAKIALEIALDEYLINGKTLREWVKIIIKQEDVLDKITTEMAELIEWHDCPIEFDNGNDAWYCEAVNRCIGIVGKYRQEG